MTRGSAEVRRAGAQACALDFRTIAARRFDGSIATSRPVDAGLGTGEIPELSLDLVLVNIPLASCELFVRRTYEM